MRYSTSLSLGLAILLTLGLLSSCEKGVEVQEKIIRDTTVVYDTLRLHDTTYLKQKGLALIRFVSVLPGQTPTVILRVDRNQSSPIYSSASTLTTKHYIPVCDSIPFTLYATFFEGSTARLDSFTVPALDPGKLITCALFLLTDPDNQQKRISPSFGDDSLKLKPAGPSQAYIRFVNGVSDFPSPVPLLNIFVGSDSEEPLFTHPETHLPQPVPFGEFHNYVPIPSGNQRLHFKATKEAASVRSLWADLVAGQYYTVKATGAYANSSLDFKVDQE